MVNTYNPGPIYFMTSTGIVGAELLRELEAMVDQVDEANTSEASALRRAEEAEKHAVALQQQLASLQVRSAAWDCESFGEYPMQFRLFFCVECRSSFPSKIYSIY